MTQFHNRYYWGLGGNIAILAVLILLRIFNILDGVNSSIFDRLGQYSPASISAEKRSLVVECTEQQRHSNAAFWLSLVENLEKNGVRQIVFLFIPSQNRALLFKTFSRDNTVFFPASGFSRSESQEDVHSSFAQEYSVQSGLLHIPPPMNGVYRQQYTKIPKGNEELPHIIYQAVQQLKTAPLSDTATFGVNFNGRQIDSQPKVDLDLVMSGSLVESLIYGKTIFIGIKQEGPFTGLLTPLSQKGQLISPAVYTAYSYDTLLHGKQIKRSGFLLSLLIFAFFILSGTVASQYMRIGPAILSVFSAFLLAGVLAWLIFAFALIQIPLAEILLGQFLLVLLIVAGKSMLSESRIRSVAFDTKQKVQERLLPADILNSQQYWVKVVGLVNQLLNLERSIFLEKVPGDLKVKEVAAANASINDISERRRDYGRYPYTEALSENGAIKVENFLSPATQEERQFLIPLKITEERVLGFWACTVSSTQFEKQKNLVPMMNTFAVQISEMLFAREQRQNELKHIQNPVRKLLALESGDGKFDEISEAFTLLGKRLSTLETVFDSLGTGAILYDLFGQVVYANQKIVGLCRELKVSPYKYSGAELITFLTGQELVQVRQILSEIIFSDEFVTFYTKELGEKQNTYRLTVSSVSDSLMRRGGGGEEPVDALSIAGILLEIQEFTDIKKVLKQKEAYYKYSSQASRGYQISFPPVLEKLRNGTLSQDSRLKLISYLENRLQSLFDFIDRLGDVLSQNVLDADAPYFPTDCMECLNAAIQKLTEEIKSNKLEYDIQIPEYMVPVLAVPEELENVFRNILLYLISDAESSSVLSFTVKRENKFIVCVLSNQGYGMPDYDFQNYLTDDEAALSPDFRRLYTARQKLEKYGGIFAARSQLGRGTEVTVKLKRFQ